MGELTERKCIEAVATAIRYVDAQPAAPGDVKQWEFYFAEHHDGFQNATGTITAGDDSYNIDFDTRCDCCGEMGAMSSVDIDGPVVVDEGAEPSENVVRAGKYAYAVLSGSIPECDCNERYAPP